MKPEGWRLGSFRDLVEVLPGYPFSSAQFSEVVGSGPPLIRIRDLAVQNPAVFVRGDYPSGYEILPGEILIGMDGDFMAAKWMGPNALLNQRVCKVWSKAPRRLDNGFLYFRLQPELDRIHAATGQTTVKHLSTKQLYEIEVSLPSYPEQRKIAAILSSIDETIELTERIVDQNQRLTEVLRDHVLTHGIGRAGRLRSQTWFGEVPSDWTETTLGAIAEGKDGLQTGPFGSQLHASDYTLDGIPVLMPRDLKDGRIDPDSVAKVPLAIAEEMSRHRLKPGDILFGRRGEIGRSALVTEAEAGWLCGTGCLRARLAETVVPEFVIEVFRSSQIIKWLNVNAVGQTMLNLNTDILARTPVLLPPIAEQRQIADLLASSVRARAATVDELGQLRLLKSALLSTLLSGELRVISAEAAA